MMTPGSLRVFSQSYMSQPDTSISLIGVKTSFESSIQRTDPSANNTELLRGRRYFWKRVYPTITQEVDPYRSIVKS